MEYTQAVRRHLEALPGVENVELDVFSGCSAQQLRDWESANRPFRLPEDLRAFLEVTNGLSLHWDVRVAGRSRPFGRINVNNIDAVRRLPLEGVFAEDDPEAVDALFEHRACGAADADADAPDRAGPAEDAGPRVAAAFDLDKMCGCGVVALVYLHERREAPPGADGADGADGAAAAAAARPARTGVYFQDLSCRWRLLATSFSEYFRLLAMHLGLPNWQYAFTPFGLDEASRQWFNLLSPDRLAIDVHAARLRAVGDGGKRDAGGKRAAHRGYIGRSSARRNREATMRIAAGEPRFLRQPDRSEIDGPQRERAAAPAAAATAPAATARSGAQHQRPFK